MPTVRRVYGSNSTGWVENGVLHNSGWHGSRGFELNMEEHTEQCMEEDMEDLFMNSGSFLLFKIKEDK